ncbi:hypothetical protein M9Y10_039105 [Tritrichomonas musculus]|uniref:Uncharacterized protein n=1 Tax=Tritrichomonas musculus TaxID=1915356 RepID=A0ABR2KAA2_9EUKA
MKKSTIGGKGTAKRKILIRQFIESTIMKERKYSDPFDDDESQEIDDSEWNIKPMKINYKRNRKLFEAQKDPDEETQPEDDILVKNRDLAEADRFIASLKLPSKKNVSLKENLAYKANLMNNYDLKETYEKFKVESQRLSSILNDDCNEIYEDENGDHIEPCDDFLI